MKKIVISITAIALTFICGYSIAYAFNSGSTGADGALNPTTNTEIQLPENGILNYTTVNIPTGVTVTFKKNAANTPAYVLATGDVTIVGTISVNGKDGSGIFPGDGGPGAFAGGFGGPSAVPGGKGLGPGSGNPGSVTTSQSYYSSGGGGGGYGSNGANGTGNATYAPAGAGGGTYGNIRILPMIGGSGAGGGAGSGHPAALISGSGGGGGSGAILIASSGTITVTGSITANGGKGGNCSSTHSGAGGGGSGGAIKLIAETISGNGTISATGGASGTSCTNSGGAGGNGLIRLEASAVTRTTATTPVHTYSNPGTVFVTNIPTLRITSIGGLNVPANPSGKYGSPDVTLPSTTTNPVTVNISATNIPVGTTVTVTSAPEFGPSTSANAALTGTAASSTASVSITLSTSYQSILMAQATFTVQTAMHWDGERIEKVRVAATIGRESDVVYITESGREIKSSEMMAKLSVKK